MTRRTVLLPAAADDLLTLSALWNDTGVRDRLFGGHALTPARTRQLLDAGLSAVEAGLGWWLVYPWSNAPALGCVGLLPRHAQGTDPGGRGETVDTMAAFGPQAWAQGYAHEAMEELVRHAVHGVGVSRLSVISNLEDPLLEGLLHTLGFVQRLEADAGDRRLRLHELDAAGARRAAAAATPAAPALPAAAGRR